MEQHSLEYIVFDIIIMQCINESIFNLNIMIQKRLYGYFTKIRYCSAIAYNLSLLEINYRI